MVPPPSPTRSWTAPEAGAGLWRLVIWISLVTRCAERRSRNVGRRSVACIVIREPRRTRSASRQVRREDSDMAGPGEMLRCMIRTPPSLPRLTLSTTGTGVSASCYATQTAATGDAVARADTSRVTAQRRPTSDKSIARHKPTTRYLAGRSTALPLLCPKTKIARLLATGSIPHRQLLER